MITKGFEMKIQSYAKEYEVIFEQDPSFFGRYTPENLAETTGRENAGKGAFYVIDRKVVELYREVFTEIPKERLFLLDALERNKTIETALVICEAMTAIPAKRNATLISVGGGITQDITGFVANVLYRGIHWIFVPTTLLAACDSCIGSKTSLNYKSYKNLLGTFYPPDELHICPAVFATLTKQDYLSGLGEVVKFNLMAGEIDAIETDLPELLARKEETIERYVQKSLAFKKPFIEADEFDRGIRIHLNFAHTFGHAFEAVTDYAIPHGTAVAMGMIMANAIAHDRGSIEDSIWQRMDRILTRIIDLNLLEQENGFTGIENFSMASILDKIKKDKKQVDENITAVLFTDEDLTLSVVHDVRSEEISLAYEHLKALL